MSKKMVFVLVIAILIAGGVFAQEDGSSGPKHWISGQLGILNAGAGYEMVLSPSLSVGGEAYYNSPFLSWTTTAVEAYVKYYPFKGKFYGKIGLGFGIMANSDGTYENAGFLIDPGIGWKIDVGRPGRFFIEPKISIPVVIGKKVDSNIAAAFAMGYAF